MIEGEIREDDGSELEARSLTERAQIPLRLAKQYVKALAELGQADLVQTDIGCCNLA